MCVCVCFCVFVCDMCRQADTGQTLKKMFLGILIMNGLLYFSLALSLSLCSVCVCVRCVERVRECIYNKKCFYEFYIYVVCSISLSLSLSLCVRCVCVCVCVC